MIISRLRRRGVPRAAALAVAALIISAPAGAVDAVSPRLQSLQDAVAAASDPVPAPSLEAKAEAVQQAFEAIGEGQASYYGRELAGNRTSSGERFNPMALTAAHRTLPLGTLLRVTNLANGRSVIVRVNDRGPFVRSRLIDVSLGAAREIGMVAQGRAQVRLEVVRTIA
ncbi:MAG: rare lipoprotein [Sphingomonadales bacterium]|jgi:rare lipoprotein A|nr:rare lipoprotein [Sphingomonadales bacterium]